MLDPTDDIDPRTTDAITQWKEYVKDLIMTLSTWYGNADKMSTLCADNMKLGALCNMLTISMEKYGISSDARPQAIGKIIEQSV